MRETQFIGQNKEKWSRFEALQRNHNADPEEMTQLFVDITDDLSYARSFYPNRSVRVYLNQLAQRSFQALYRNKRGGLGRVVHFWVEDLPRLLFAQRAELRLSLLLFIGAMLIGAISSAFDPDFPRTILGGSYIAMTEANISQGDPMAVYKSKNEFGMFFAITVNNLLVAFRIFVFGVLAAIGTVIMLLYNGIMVGTFQYFFIERGIYLDSFLTIWLHGTLEIGSAIIAGGAGLVLGKGLLFPGTYSRMQSFLLHARRGLRILLGTVPIFILAAFIEGYFTRYTDAPYAVRLLLILASLAFLIGYFVWYPMHKGRSPAPPAPEEQLYPSPRLQFEPGQVYTSGMIFSFSFLLYKRWFWRFARWAAIGALGIALILTLMDDTLSYRLQMFDVLLGLLNGLLNVPVIFNFNEVPVLALPVLAAMLLLMGGTVRLVHQEISGKRPTWHRAAVMVLVPALLTTGIFFIQGSLGMISTLAWVPLAMLWVAAIANGKGDIGTGLRNAISLFTKRGGRIIGLYLMMVLTAFIFIMLMNSPLNSILAEIISWNTLLTASQFTKIEMGLIVFAVAMAVLMALSFVLLGMMLKWYTLTELRDAAHLKERIKSLKRA